METIGIMAGSGQFPFLVAQGARKRGMRVVICGFYGNADPALVAEADVFRMVHLGQLGKLIKFFARNGATKACMAGAISKPRALEIKPDLRVAKLIFKLVGNRSMGDDAILRAVAEELQSDGITVVPPDTLAPELRSAPGVLTTFTPNDEIWEDVRFGHKTAKAIGALDIGQCVVVRSGIVIAVEGIEGTDATITRAGELGGPGCTIVKVVKPGQDTRLDLPSIGAATIELLAKYKYACLAFDAGGTLFFDREEALGMAHKHSISVIAIPESPENFFSSRGTA
ncbi:UDP-2,3-diacylglucosamine diphosphatase LpxI [Desulfovibrio sp. OttesenSCG-928-G15]|nr:UDP-2,3-diacylglucosamine diphosphatase LpxI [Desulfovibrio sp. OttesenSCG-928-G15]